MSGRGSTDSGGGRLESVDLLRGIVDAEARPCARVVRSELALARGEIALAMGDMGEARDQLAGAGKDHLVCSRARLAADW